MKRAVYRFGWGVGILVFVPFTGARLVPGASSVALRTASDTLPVPRMYVFDCGTLRGRNLKAYGLPPEQRDLSVACELIVDPHGTLLWETGLGDEYVDGRPRPGDPGWHVDRTLVGQLAAIGVRPEDITYLAISHMHADHTGNADLFAGSIWIVQKRELDWAFGGRDTASYGALARSRKIVLNGDYDVFGDSVAEILFTPGHTPGHQSLLVRLPETGPVVLSGDLYHYPEERTFHKIPSFDFNRAETAASRARVDSLIARTGAQLWIEHDILGYAKLKKSPEYYR